MTIRNHSAVRKNGNGRVKRLNKAAFKVVDENADTIATALLKATTEGHVLSARLLVELAEGDVDVEEAVLKRPLRTLAMRLAEQPQWTGEAPDAAAETETGIRQTVGE